MVFSGQVVTSAIGSDAFQEVGRAKSVKKISLLTPISGRCHWHIQSVYKSKCSSQGYMSQRASIILIPNQWNVMVKNG